MKKIVLFILLITGTISFAQCPPINGYSANAVQFSVAGGSCNSYPSTVDVTNNDTGITYTMSVTCTGNSPKLTYSDPSADIGNNFTLSFDGSITECIFVGGVLPVQNFDLLSDSISLFPNPIKNTELLNINNSNNLELSVSIFDITGKLVMNNIASNKNQLKVNISNLNQGVYLIKLVSDKNMTAKKLVVTN